MARIYKAEVYIIDPEDEFEEVRDVNDFIENRLGDIVLVDITDIQESKSFYWHDELKVNRTYATKEDYEYYFKKDVK